MHIGSDPRRAWRQWCIASVQWQERWEQFLQDAPPLPLGALVGSRRALSRALMARHTAEQAMHAQRPAFPEVCRDLTCANRDIISFTPVRMLADCVEASKS